MTQHCEYGVRVTATLSDGGRTVPAEPQQEGAEAHERRAVPAEAILGLAVVVEAAAAGADDDGAAQPADTAHHVHHGRAREIHHAHAQKRVRVASAQPACEHPTRL